jgi:hypothetical protein
MIFGQTPGQSQSLIAVEGQSFGLGLDDACQLPDVLPATHGHPQPTLSGRDIITDSCD